MIDEKVTNRLHLIEDKDLRLVGVSFEQFLENGTDYISNITMKFALPPNIKDECEVAFLIRNSRSFHPSDEIWDSPCPVSLIIEDLCADGMERCNFKVRECEGLFSFYCERIEVIL